MFFVGDESQPPVTKKVRVTQITSFFKSKSAPQPGCNDFPDLSDRKYTDRVNKESSYDSSSQPLDVSDGIPTSIYMEAIEPRSENESIKPLPVLNHSSPPEFPETAPDEFSSSATRFAKLYEDD